MSPNPNVAPKPAAAMGRYEFAVVSALRTHQLMAGSVARVDGIHKPTTTACMEVAGGFVAGLPHTDQP